MAAVAFLVSMMDLVGRSPTVAGGWRYRFVIEITIIVNPLSIFLGGSVMPEPAQKCAGTGTFWVFTRPSTSGSITSSGL